MNPGRTPTHSLPDVQSACRRAGGIVFRGQVLTDASEIYHDPDEIIDCICGLDSTHFRKTMPSDKRPGRFQDVYKTHSHGYAVYIKFDYDATAGRVILLSFKRDEDA